MKSPPKRRNYKHVTEHRSFSDLSQPRLERVREPRTQQRGSLCEALRCVRGSLTRSSLRCER